MMMQAACIADIFGGDSELPGTPFSVSKASADLMSKAVASVGVMVTGRRTFDISDGWGSQPPLGVHQVMLTHRLAPEWEKDGSPFTFIFSGVKDAIQQAKKMAGQKDVCISYANILQQALNEKLVDEIHIDLVHVLPGTGKPLFANTIQPNLEVIRTVNGTGVTHLGFKVMY
jgi:dihydrofolate reductase